jgi:hypothetical protein
MRFAEKFLYGSSCIAERDTTKFRLDRFATLGRPGTPPN